MGTLVKIEIETGKKYSFPMTDEKLENRLETYKKEAADFPDFIQVKSYGEGRPTAVYKKDFIFVFMH